MAEKSANTSTRYVCSNVPAASWQLRSRGWAVKAASKGQKPAARWGHAASTASPSHHVADSRVATHFRNATLWRILPPTSSSRAASGESAIVHAATPYSVLSLEGSRHFARAHAPRPRRTSCIGRAGVVESSQTCFESFLTEPSCRPASENQTERLNVVHSTRFRCSRAKLRSVPAS